MFQTLYTNKKHGWSVETTPTAEFMRQYEAAIAAYPLMVYPIENGIKQGIADAGAGCESAEEYSAEISKKADKIWSGTVASPGTGVAREPSKSPLEKEMFAIASKEMADVLTRWEKKNGTLKKADRNGLIHQYLVKHNEAILARANENLAKLGTLAKEASLDLDAVMAAIADESPAVEETTTKKTKKAA